MPNSCLPLHNINAGNFRKGIVLCVMLATLLVLWTALMGAIPTRAAPRQQWDDDTTIVNVTHIPLGARDVILDPTRQVLYASLPSNLGAEGNRIVPLTVPTGTLGTHLFVGSEPNRMALSDDGEYLYVGLDGANAVRRVNLISYTAEIQVPLGSGTCGDNTASEIIVLQDNPQSIAVAKGGAGCSPGQNGVTIYDGTTARPDSTQEYVTIGALERSLSPTLLYGQVDGYGGFVTLAISPTGVAISDSVGGGFSGYLQDIQLHEGLLYGSDGTVVDPTSQTVVGSYDGNGPFAVDAAQGVVYMATSGWDSPTAIMVFHQTEFTKIKTIPLININGYSKRLFLIDAQHLALFTDTGHLYLIELGEYVPQPPTFVSVPPLTVNEEAQYTYYYTATDPNYGEVVVVTAPGLPTWLYIDPYNIGTGTVAGYSYYSNFYQGKHPVELVATDNQGMTTTQKFTITVIPNPAYVAPTFTSTPVLSATEQVTYTYNVVATDENDDTLSFYALVKPDWLELDDIENGKAQLHGIPAPEDIGDHAVELRVSDPKDRISTQRFTVTVASQQASAPVFSSTPILAATQGMTYTYVATANSAFPSQLLTISATTLPSWLALTPLVNGAVTLHGTPTQADVGPHAVALQVVDSQGLTNTQNFTVMVVGLDELGPPAFGSTPPLGAAEGITYTYLVTASSALPGDLLTISAMNLPEWLSLMPVINGAALLRGVAAPDDIGEAAVALLVADSRGMTATQTFTLTVVAVGQLEGLLFDDQNGNGKQEQGEAGIAGAMVSLTPVAESVTAMLFQQTGITTTTDSLGAYRFTNIPTGDYTVSFDLPGDVPNPPTVTVAIVGDRPLVIAPVAVSPTVDPATMLYLPTINDSAKAITVDMR